MIKREGKEFDIPARASSRPPLASEPGASRIMPAGGYPGHQKRVSIKRKGGKKKKKKASIGRADWLLNEPISWRSLHG